MKIFYAKPFFHFCAIAIAVSITCLSDSAPQGPEMIRGELAEGNQIDKGVIFKSIDMKPESKKQN